MMKKREKKGLMRIVSLCTAGLVLLTACGGSGGNGRDGQDAQGSAMTSAEAVAEASASAGASDDAAGTDPAVPAEASDAGTADAADAVGNADAPAGTGDTAAAAGSAVSAVPGAEDTEAAVDEAALAAEADRILGGMSMDEKISQMIIPAIRTWDEQDVTDLGQVPALAEALRRHQYGGIILFSGNVIGELVVEDLEAVLLMVILSTLAVSKTFDGMQLVSSMLKLVFFLLVWFLGGIFLVPTILRWARKFMSEETLTVFSVGLCFLMVVLANLAGFSSALGAFSTYTLAGPPDRIIAAGFISLIFSSGQL